MSTHVKSTHAQSTASHKTSTHSNPQSPKEGETMSIQSTTIAAPVTPASTATPSPAKTPVTSLAAGLLPLPPDITIPSPPQGYEPTSGISFRGLVPWTAELVVLPKVLQDLARFTAYSNVFGGTAPPLAQVIEAFTVGGKWSAMRAASAAWDAYCRDEEGSAWRLINAILDRLRPSFALAVQGDASIATTYPSLAELLGVKKANALRGAATRKRNTKADAEGKPATHGGAGKAREKKAAKAALAAANAAASTAAEGTAAPEAAAAAAPVTSAAGSAAPKAVGQ